MGAFPVTEKVCKRMGVKVFYDNPLTDGPIWRPDGFHFCELDMYGDAGAFHEVCHLVVSAPWQRKYPDLAMGMHVNASGGNEEWSTDDYVNRDVGYCRSWGDEERLDRASTIAQESLATSGVGLFNYFQGSTKWNTDVDETTLYTMEEFSAWYNGDYSWSTKTSKEIAESFAKFGFADEYDYMLYHLEAWRQIYSLGLIWNQQLQTDIPTRRSTRAAVNRRRRG